jgi:hypothetical protein
VRVVDWPTTPSSSIGDRCVGGTIREETGRSAKLRVATGGAGKSPRRAIKFETGSGGTGGKEPGDDETLCRKPTCALTVPERTRPRACVPACGLAMATGTGSSVRTSIPSTPSCNSLWVFLAFREMELWLVLGTPSSGTTLGRTSVTGGSTCRSSCHELVRYKARLTKVKGRVLRGMLGRW